MPKLVFKNDVLGRAGVILTRGTERDEGSPEAINIKKFEFTNDSGKTCVE